MRLDGAGVQAEAAELSRSRCLGCCQRLEVGKEPGDGDRVSGRGEKAERREKPAGKGPGVEATGPKDAPTSKPGGGGVQGRKGWARAEGTRKAKEVYDNHCPWECWERGILDGRRAG